jgi:hypothetical protein
MSYPIITLHTMQVYVSSRRDGSGLVNKPEATVRGTGDDSFEKIRKDVLAILDEWKKSLKTIGENVNKKEALEGELSAELFRALMNLRVSILTDPDFWRFLSCHYFYDFIEWRDGKDCALASFGANANAVNFDCVPYRMFNRGLIAFGISEDEDDLSYAEVPGTDLWRSHILRVMNSLSVTMTQAILDRAIDKKLPTAVVREVVKRLRKNRANILFEVLTYDEALEMLDDEIIWANKFLKK